MYQIETFGGISIANADCMDVMRDLPDNAYDLAICDPPYGIGIEKRIQFGLDFVTKWAQELNIELPFFVAQKMRYNVMRPYRNGKRY